jgi:signal transduction histidine kinase
MSGTAGTKRVWRGMAPLLLAVVALIGSVVIPAFQSWQILSLLRQTTEALAPAKIITTELQAGMIDELSLLRPQPGASDPPERYHRVVEANTLRLDSLARIGPRLDVTSRSAILDVMSRVLSWRAAAAVIPFTAMPNVRGERLDAAVVRHDSVQRALATLSSHLATETEMRNERVRLLERASLAWNILLVVTAFAGLAAVIVLVTRDRHALADAERRSSREVTLREAAEAMAAAFTLHEVMQCVTDAACRIADGRSAFIEQIIPGGAPGIVVGARSGIGAPDPGTRSHLAGSITEAVLNAGTPRVVNASSTGIGSAGASESILVVPLGNSRQPIGALFVLSGSRSRFRADDVASAGIFGHLASLALEKIRVLDDAKEARSRLERVLASRSRLIRGFSHDVKNPVGAADGYAALLTEGIYGDLTVQQLEAVGHLRRSIHSALALIDDLHELARAETGRLVVTRERIDVNALLLDLVLEYEAAARSGGLTLSTRLDPQLPEVTTSSIRVQQIVSNLLSNAIKYTREGSVTVETLVHDADPEGMPGDWIQIRVSDTGPGIPHDKQEYIFEEFSRIGPHEKSGAGLGLAISRLLARALGGQITVESSPGMGSHFTLWLPFSCPDVPAPAGAS